MNELLELAQDPELADRVVVVVEAAVAEAHQRTKLAPIPSEEQTLWREVGAVFEDDAAPVRASLRSTMAMAELVGRCLHGDAVVARKLHVDRSRVSQRLAEHSLYAFELEGERHFPEWQFLDDKAISGLKTVLSALNKGLHPLVVDHWFRTSNLDLEIDDYNPSRAEWLATGGDPRVLLPLVPAS